MVIAKSAAISESARERETFKYDALIISTAGLNGPDPPKPIPSSFLSSTPDPGLTAFAQLGLYRLNAARALISLFDRKFQHIVAEALRPLPPTTDPEAQQDRNWFNGLAFERATSVCEHVVTGAASGQSVPGTDHGLAAGDIPVSVIEHIDQDARFCQLEDPGRQFYAGVPIRSPTGINIGVYCVFDDKPRPGGLSADEVRFIREMSRVVMDYLESKRSHEWYRRDQRMLRGLGSFVKGQGTLWNSTEALEDPASFQDLPGMGEGLLNARLQPQPQSEKATIQQEQRQTMAADLKASVADHHVPSTWSGHDRGVADGGRTSKAQPSSSENPAMTPAPDPQGTPAKPDSLQASISRVFSKAANVSRESVEVEGVVFLDASVRSPAGLVTNSLELPTLSEVRHTSSGVSSSDEGFQGTSHDSGAAGTGICDVLGFATSHRSSIAGDAAPKSFAVCKERFLLRLLRKYPLGHVWNFEADGTVSDNSTSSETDIPPANTPEALLPQLARRHTAEPHDRPKRRLTTSARIVKMFPGARSVLLVPLWDAQTGRISAGGFMWTCTPTRTFSEENELAYMRVFALTIMAEAARLKMRVADKAKTDLLGSFSHELRSPLHGLVGAVELLRHTTLDTMQDGILRAIEASGRTLLDTIEHLLDYVKITSQQSSKSRRRHTTTAGVRQRSSLPTSDLSALPESPVRLDLLVEEVVESVLAGSSYLTKSETPPSMLTSTQTANSPKHTHFVTTDPTRVRFSGSTGLVQTYLDVDPSAKWTFCMHPGAFRRIIMNLFGNSLKFTRSGFIRVSLRQETKPKRAGVPSATHVVLTVSDSGKGISEEYLRNHLFTPFSQEDQFASGTGLGLSLVRHMTVTQGGMIDVSSKVGQGSTVTVTLPLSQVVQETIDEEGPTFLQSLDTLAGRRVRLYGFDSKTRAPEDFSAIDSKKSSQYQLMEAICRENLHLNVVAEDSAESEPPDFVVCAAGDGLTCADVEALNHVSSCPYIFVCQELASTHRLTDVEYGVLPTVYEVCSQPIGLKKLATAFLACQRRWHGLARSDSVSTPGVTGSNGRADVQRLSQLPRPQLEARDLTIQLAQNRKHSIAKESGPHVFADFRDTTSPPQPLLARESIDAIQAKSIATDMTDIPPEPRRPILIVDDNNINLKIMAAFLTKLKYTYTMAVNGLEALDIYTKAPAEYSCVLTDISMPIMDGLESTRRIREFERSGGHKPVVVIALTGLSGPEVRENAVASGVDLFLTRPLALKGLEKALIATGLL
ncbi:uncharacterized protein JN550_005881 [Neoarthrinium moseri]|uniref:uncharacterized protein n=1 Tax=Neoarthrinium moseri TaxID=1658444 RepID=UPI001FDB0B30|nr:uncharacterized protein JN550_005881 [Neoarthrinium moseri]KAI1869251.1 hypothetical protein JN550_005881 [Neoarthrinium moseri]